MKKFLAVLMVAIMVVASVCVVAADEFTPSVTAKSAPEVESSVIIAADGTETEVAVEVVSYANRSENAEVKAALDEAYTALSDGTVKEALKSELTKIAQAVNSSYTEDNLVVSDLFYMEVDDAAKSVLANGGKLEVVYDLGLGANDPCPAVVYACNGDDWAVVDPADVVNNGDGTITVKYSTLCPIAMMSVSSTAVSGGETPAQSHTAAIVVIIIVAFCVGVATTLLVVLIKKAKASKAA